MLTTIGSIVKYSLRPAENVATTILQERHRSFSDQSHSPPHRLLPSAPPSPPSAALSPAPRSIGGHPALARAAELRASSSSTPRVVPPPPPPLPRASIHSPVAKYRLFFGDSDGLAYSGCSAADRGEAASLRSIGARSGVHGDEGGDELVMRSHGTGCDDVDEASTFVLHAGRWRSSGCWRGGSATGRPASSAFPISC